ncbi:polysaccharide deacetylase family protein [Uliginosibacterium sediminicola]|uniref:Polysaccharide deacetylase family protein n=1 Tax=Uliginosibacterium sediminicola TaxID=2024550 RepID=A0ABU9Z0Z8_9RHOO
MGVLIAQPIWWRGALLALIINHLLLAAVGLWPRSNWLGVNLTRLPATPATHNAVAITIDDGPDPQITPQVLEILAKHKAQASFFCIGRKLHDQPALARSIVAAGHAIENHSEHHRHNFSLLGPAAMEREVAQAQASISSLSGRRPFFFRAPAGLRNPFLDRVLHRQGLRLASWTRRGFDTRERNAQKVLARLLDGLRAGDILLLHDGNAARDGSGRAIILEVLPQLLKEIEARGLRTIRLDQALDADGSLVAQSR